MMLTARKGTIATANRLKLWVTPCTMPRSALGNQSCIARVAAGNAPDSANPKTKRIPMSDPTPAAMAVIAVIRDQKGTTIRSTKRGPSRSASHPSGICPIAYAHKKTLNTMPTAVWLSPNFFAIAGAAIEMPVRSIYVIMYIRLINRRTSQRILLGLEVVFPGRARSGTEMRVVSGIRSGAVSRGLLDRLCLPQSRPIRKVRGGQKAGRTPLFRRFVCGLVDLHYHPGMLWRHQRLLAVYHALEKMNGFCFHGAGVYMIALLSRHG